MAQQHICDICQDEVGVQMLTNLTDGTTLIMGGACLPVFYGQSTLMTMQAGEHKGPAAKCQACRRVHERMTTPVAPIGAAGDNHDEIVPGQLTDDTSGVAP